MNTKVEVNWQGDFKTSTGMLNIDNSVLDQLQFAPIFAKEQNIDQSRRAVGICPSSIIALQAI
jgi:hypothetical protein